MSDIQDYNMDLVETAAYVRWIRDGIKPEHDYPWYKASKPLTDQAPTSDGDSVPTIRRGQGGGGRTDLDPGRSQEP